MAGFISDRSYDYGHGDFGEDSDDERAESSEDEIDILLHGTPEQRRRLHHHHQRRQLLATDAKRSAQHCNVQKDVSSSEDEFEREMNAELDKTVHMLEQVRGKKQKLPDKTSSTASAEAQSNQSGVPMTTSTSESSKFYDDIYFDSDDENNFQGEGDARVKRHHTQPSNDDLLYDPDMDDEDQRWVDKQRQRQRGQHGNSLVGDGDKRRRGGKRKGGASNTDAVLDCPACMTTLCIDCQRHDIYPHQFRAMFVMNCRVDNTELLRVPEQAPKKKAKKSKKPATPSGDGGWGGASGSGSVAGESVEDSKDKFHPVKCNECDTVVGVIDMDEVYHFFNVLTSLP